MSDRTHPEYMKGYNAGSRKKTDANWNAAFLAAMGALITINDLTPTGNINLAKYYADIAVKEMK